MTLLQMSLTGGVFILAVAALRKLTLNKLPKRTFLILWDVVLLRLLIPFDLPSRFSVYSLLSRVWESALPPVVSAADPAPAPIPTPAVPAVSSGPTVEMGATHAAAEIGMVPAPNLPVPPSTVPAIGGWTINPWLAVWAVGAIALAVWFALSYLRCRRQFRESLPVEQPFAARWLTEHPFRRRVDIRQSDRIAAPVTYGVLRPVILLPKRLCGEDESRLTCVLTHESIHIRRLDGAVKILAVLALCLHWFNPLVWVMNVLLSRDMELACDEQAVHRLGPDSKSAYAMALIDLEEQKSGLISFGSHFSQNAMEERIGAIMKLKKRSVLAVIAAVCLIAGLTTAFATSAAEDRRAAEEAARLKEESARQTEEEAVRRSQAVSDYWDEILAPYVPLGLSYTFDDPDHDGYGLSMEFNGLEVWGVMDPHNGYWFSETLEGGSGLVLYAQYEDGAPVSLRTTEAGADDPSWAIQRIALCGDAPYTAVLFEHIDMRGSIGNSGEPGDYREYYTDEPGTAEDYASLLTLKTADYRGMSLADFNERVYQWVNDHPDEAKRIQYDLCLNRLPVYLTPEEEAFIHYTYWPSLVDMLTCELRRDGCFGSSDQFGVPDFSRKYQQGLLGDCPVAWYKMSCDTIYSIPDWNALTVGERDDALYGSQNAVYEYFNQLSLAELMELTPEAWVELINSQIVGYSTAALTIHPITREEIGADSYSGGKLADNGCIFMGTGW